jgi:hypothetical protein
LQGEWVAGALTVATALAHNSSASTGMDFVVLTAAKEIDHVIKKREV